MKKNVLLVALLSVCALASCEQGPKTINYKLTLEDTFSLDGKTGVIEMEGKVGDELPTNVVSSNQYYVFDGWYLGEQKVTTVQAANDNYSMKYLDNTPTISFAETTASLFVTQTIKVNPTVTKFTDAITYTVEDKTIASVDKEGNVQGLKQGETKLKASLTDKIYAELKLVVKDTVVDLSVNKDNFDFTGVFSEKPVVKSKGNQNSFAKLTGAAGKYYVAESKVKVLTPDAGDTWSRVGISHLKADKALNTYYGLQVSPGPNFNARKTVTMLITDGNVQWGTITDRSQVWGQHNLGALNFNEVKLTSVRKGDEFFSFVNDQLYYYDNGVDALKGVDSYPILNVGSAAAEFSAISTKFGEKAVNDFLAKADNSDYFAADDKTKIENGKITFSGASDSTCALNAKDHAAKSLGIKAALPAEKEATLSFDLKCVAFGGRDALPALAVTTNRYDGAYAEARSMVIGQYKAGWTGWNSNGNLNEGIGSGGVAYQVNGEEARLEEGSTYHVEFKRVMETEGQDNILKITDKDGHVLLENKWGWVNDGYKGRVNINFLNRDFDCEISNIKIVEAK